VSLSDHAGSPASCEVRRLLSQFPAELSVVLVARTPLGNEDEEKRNPIAGRRLAPANYSVTVTIARSLVRLGNSDDNGGPADVRILRQSTCMHEATYL
jgi:hypothetical protein